MQRVEEHFLKGASIQCLLVEIMVLPKYGVIGTRSHGGTEVKPILQRCRRHKEQRRCSLQILDNYLGVNALYINY